MLSLASIISWASAYGIDALAADRDDGAESDDKLPAPGKPAVEKGDLWLLGHHRLICADARDDAAIATLMDRAQAQMVFIDPPYNARSSGMSRAVAGGRGFRAVN